MLILSFLLAFVTWTAHNLTQDYMVYLQYRVRVTANLEGYAPTAVSEEELVLGGQAAGFYILGHRDGRGKPLEIKADARYFTADPTRPDVFLLDLSQFRDQLDDAVGSSFDVNYIPSTPLSFAFVPQSCKKVPVTSRLSVSCRPQYMETAELQLTPDSVLVYGPVKDLQRLTEVRTRTIAQVQLDKSLQGYVEIEPVAGLRIDTEQVWYDIEVDRYVENTMTLPVKATGVPAGYTLMVLPSQVEVTFRAPFRPRGGRIVAEDLSLEVDYRDFAGAGSTRVIPQLVTARDVYTWRLRPELVECILMETR